MTDPQSDTTEQDGFRRIHGLDALRGVLMMLGVVVHTSLVYLPWGWVFSDWTATTPHLALVFDSIHMFRMPAFFLLAGFFGAMLWQRRGARSMMNNRFARIVLPFVVFVLLLHPLQTLCFGFGQAVSVFQEVPINMAWDGVLEDPLPDGTMHLWFLYHLIFVTTFMAMLVSCWERMGWAWAGGLRFVRRVMESPWLFVWVLGSLNFAWCAMFDWDHLPTDGSWGLEQPDIIVYYCCFYGLGWLLFVSRAPLAKFQDGAWFLVALGVFATVLRNAISEHYDPGSAGPWVREAFEPVWALLGGLPPTEADVQHWHWLLASVGLVGFTRGFMGLFLRYCGGGSPLWRYLSDSSYWVFLIHLPLTVAVPTLLLGWQVPAFIKFPASMAIVLFISWLSYDAVIRPTRVGKFLNGRRYPSLHRGFSTVGTVIAVAWLGFGMAWYPAVSERPPPWRNGFTPAELLPEESVVYPLQPTVRLESVTHTWCVGVDRYILCVDKVSPDNMEKGCAALGASVALFKTKPEQERVGQIASALSLSPFWLAITDAQYEGWWRWPDGTVLNRDAPWHDNEPNNWDGQEHCAAMNWGGIAKWNDFSCDNALGFVCERTSVPDADSAAPER